MDSWLLDGTSDLIASWRSFMPSVQSANNAAHILVQPAVSRLYLGRPRCVMPSLFGDMGSHYACTSMAGKNEAHRSAELIAAAATFTYRICPMACSLPGIRPFHARPVSCIYKHCLQDKQHAEMSLDNWQDKSTFGKDPGHASIDVSRSSCALAAFYIWRICAMVCSLPETIPFYAGPTCDTLMHTLQVEHA